MPHLNANHWGVWLVAAVMGLSSAGAYAQPHAPKHFQQHPHSMGAAKHSGGHHARHAKRHIAHPHGVPPGQSKRMGTGPERRWVPGVHVPAQYRGARHVVHDWRAHGLKHPPRGHQWVRYGGDYLLVALATGVIAQLIVVQ